LVAGGLAQRRHVDYDYITICIDLLELGAIAFMVIRMIAELQLLVGWTRWLLLAG
jgi:hypothetical protein